MKYFHYSAKIIVNYKDSTYGLIDEFVAKQTIEIPGVFLNPDVWDESRVQDSEFVDFLANFLNRLDEKLKRIEDIDSILAAGLLLGCYSGTLDEEFQTSLGLRPSDF